jgi:Pyruvate phosphate dikinase, AMP/ATP-binding domain
MARHYRDMQDLEFTVEQGKLWMLQTRLGKRIVSSSEACFLAAERSDHLATGRCQPR